MLFRAHRLPRQLHPIFLSICKRHLSTSTPSKPLNILFCGADAFSLPSLKALHSLYHSPSSPISSLTVLCRADKYTGRGLKTLSSPPIKPVAQSLSLPLLQLDTFTGWSPPSPIDLIVTVSFGLLVPGRILKAATWGGVNVHPSLLPDLRGPAPIQRALLEGRTEMGVSLQTMHPERFDAGEVLDRRKVGVAEEAGLDEMIEVLGGLGAEMLVDGIVTGRVMGGNGVVRVDGDVLPSSHAPKITPEDRRVDWRKWDADKASRYDRVLGNLWDLSTFRSCYPAKADAQGDKRITFQGPWKRLDAGNVEIIGSAESAVICRIGGVKGVLLALRTADGSLVSPASATIEGEQKGKALQALTQGLRDRVKNGG